jgi:D-xylose transport system substrate-binding protein
MKSLKAAAGLLAVSALALAALSGCAQDGTPSGSASAGGDKVIALLLPDNASSRYEKFDKPLFEAAVADLCSDCTVIYSNADNDVSKQLDQANAAIQNGAKVLVVQAANSEGSKPVADAAQAAGVPVIAYERQLRSPGTTYFASLDGVRTGGLQAKAIIDALVAEGKPKGPVLMLNGSPTDSGAADYKKGATDAFNAAGVEILDSFDTPGWEPPQAQAQMDQWITKYGLDGFAAVYAANGGTAGAASASIKSAGGDPGKYYITGQDAELSELQRIVVGEQYETIYKPLKILASTAAAAAVAIVNGEKPDASVFSNTFDMGSGEIPTAYVEAISVTADNISDTVIKDDFLTVDEICTGQYAAGCTELGLK